MLGLEKIGNNDKETIKSISGEIIRA